MASTFVSALHFYDLTARVCLYTIVLWDENTFRGLIAEIMLSNLSYD